MLRYKDTAKKRITTCVQFFKRVIDDMLTDIYIFFPKTRDIKGRSLQCQSLVAAFADYIYIYIYLRFRFLFLTQQRVLLTSAERKSKGCS